MKTLISGLVEIAKLVIILYAVYYAIVSGLVERVINMF